MIVDLYKKQLDSRYPSMRLALDLLEKRNGRTIVETGCIRLENDWGAGLSTLFWGEYASTHGGSVLTIDINKANLEVCQKVTEKYADYIQYIQGDGALMLSGLKDKIVDLLYLDSFDYPYGELLNIYGGQTNIIEAQKQLKELGDEEIVKRHIDIIRPCQEHCFEEFVAAKHALHPLSLVMIDDANLPGGGKARLVSDWLARNGWNCLWADQQVLWSKV